MSRPSDAVERAAREIERSAARERRERRDAARAAEREREHTVEDRELAVRRLRAIVNAEPQDVDRVVDRFDALEADVLRERAADERARPPITPPADFGPAYDKENIR